MTYFIPPERLSYLPASISDRGDKGLELLQNDYFYFFLMLSFGFSLTPCCVFTRLPQTVLAVLYISQFATGSGRERTGCCYG